MDAGMVQMNVRVDAQEKRSAEEVLARVGSSLTEYVRQAIAKAARGARDYEEARAVLAGDTPERMSEAALTFSRETARIREEFAALSREHGLDYALFPAPSDTDARSYRDAAYHERELERGVVDA